MITPGKQTFQITPNWNKKTLNKSKAFQKVLTAHASLWNLTLLDKFSSFFLVTVLSSYVIISSSVNTYLIKLPIFIFLPPHRATADVSLYISFSPFFPEIEQNILRSLTIFTRESIYLMILIWKSYRFLSKTKKRISGFSFTVLNWCKSLELLYLTYSFAPLCNWDVKNDLKTEYKSAIFALPIKGIGRLIDFLVTIHVITFNATIDIHYLELK